jgi:hypothetical protein
MPTLHGSATIILALACALAACKDSGNPAAPHGRTADVSSPLFTKSVGSTSTLLARSTFAGERDRALVIKRISDDWRFDLKTKPAMDVAVQSIVFAPGGQSGWHSHPGPVLIQVVSGTMTFYEGNDPACRPIVRSAGQSYLDLGEHTHIARNETNAQAENIVTYFVPPGAALRIDQPDPGNCPF